MEVIRLHLLRDLHVQMLNNYLEKLEHAMKAEEYLNNLKNILQSIASKYLSLPEDLRKTARIYCRFDEEISQLSCYLTAKRDENTSHIASFHFELPYALFYLSLPLNLHLGFMTTHTNTSHNIWRLIQTDSFDPFKTTKISELDPLDFFEIIGEEIQSNAQQFKERIELLLMATYDILTAWQGNHALFKERIPQLIFYHIKPNTSYTFSWYGAYGYYTYVQGELFEEEARDKLLTPEHSFIKLAIKSTDSIHRYTCYLELSESQWQNRLLIQEIFYEPSSDGEPIRHENTHFLALPPNSYSRLIQLFFDTYKMRDRLEHLFKGQPKREIHFFLDENYQVHLLMDSSPSRNTNC